MVNSNQLHLDHEHFRPSFAVDGVVFAMLENELNVFYKKRRLKKG